VNSAVLQWHEHPRLVSAGQSVPMKVVIWVCATALLHWHGVTIWLPLAVALVMFFPEQRHRIVAIAAAGAISAYFVTRKRVTFDGLLVDPGVLLLPSVQIAGILGGLYLAYWLCRHFAVWPTLARRYPILTLHVGFWTGLALVGPIPALAILIELGPWLIWRLSFMAQLASRRRFDGTTFSDHLMYLWPVFGGNTPFGKGFEYLTRQETTDAAAFTQSQLSGIKLLLLAAVWQWVLLLMDALVLGGDPAGLPSALAILAAELSLSVPPLSVAITTADTGTGAAWASMFVELVRATLVVAVRGHIVVGCLRLLGFNVFRNTYKPLLSLSILEFWGRYSFYFKELMVEFFFYPVFLRSTWAGARLRLFLAVFAAAFVGNMYFHALLYPNLLAAGDLGAIWSQLNSRTVYCFLLAMGVWVSMLRQQRQRGHDASRSWSMRLRAMAGVWTFYAVIHVWNVRSPGATLSDRTDFCLRLVGIN